MLRHLLTVGFLAGACAVPSLRPAVAADASDNGRFTLMPWEDELLRLDTRTGALSVCAINDAQVQCRAGADERAALESEIERLQKENSELKAKVGTGAVPPATTTPAPDPGPPGAAAPPGPRAELPNDPDLERALDYAERMMRRIMRALRDERPGDRT